MAITQNYRTLLCTNSTALGASATYTGSSYDISLFKNILYRVFADQGGTLNVQQSDDGSTWDTVTSQAITANTPAFVSVTAYLKYVRVTLVNGATAQTVLRLSGYGSGL